MAVNDTFHVTGVDVADANALVVDGSTSGTGAAEVHELAGTADAEVYRESDPNDDGTYEISVLIDTTTDNWHSQQNQLTVSQSNNHRIRIVNTSGNPQSYFATGMEVND
jgi:hypothetical protein